MTQEHRLWCFVARAVDKDKIIKTGWKGERLYSSEEGARRYYQAHHSDQANALRLFEVHMERVNVRQAGGKDSFGNYALAQVPARAIRCVRTLSKGAGVVDIDYLDHSDPEEWVVVEPSKRPVDFAGDGLKIAMETVYIAHPVGGDVEANIAKVRNICRQLHTSSRFPLAPYAFMCQYLDDNDPEQRELGIQSNLFFFQQGMIDELWLYGDRISVGMLCEIKVAMHYRIPVVPKTEGTRQALKELDLGIAV